MAEVILQNPMGSGLHVSQLVGPNSTTNLSLMQMYQHPGLWWEKRRRMLNLPENTEFSDQAKFQQTFGDMGKIANINTQAKYDISGIAQDPQTVAWFERAKGIIELDGYVNRPLISVEQLVNTPANEGTNAFAGSAGEIRNNISKAGPEMVFPKVNEMMGKYGDAQAGLYAWNLTLDPKDPLSQQFAQSLFDPNSKLNHQVYHFKQINEAESDKLRRTLGGKSIHKGFGEIPFADVNRGTVKDEKGNEEEKDGQRETHNKYGFGDDDDDDDEDGGGGGAEGGGNLDQQAGGMIREFTKSNLQPIPETLLNTQFQPMIIGRQRAGYMAAAGPGIVEHSSKFRKVLTVAHSLKEQLERLNALNQAPPGRGGPLTSEDRAVNTVQRLQRHSILEMNSKDSESIRQAYSDSEHIMNSSKSKRIRDYDINIGTPNIGGFKAKRVPGLTTPLTNRSMKPRRMMGEDFATESDAPKTIGNISSVATFSDKMTTSYHDTTKQYYAQKHNSQFITGETISTGSSRQGAVGFSNTSGTLGGIVANTENFPSSMESLSARDLRKRTKEGFSSGLFVTTPSPSKTRSQTVYGKKKHK